MVAFKPPARGITVEVPYRSIVLRADPDFEYKNRHQIFYEFSKGREFREDENQHGAYLPSGPASVVLNGVGVTGNAGLLLPAPLVLAGVSSVGSTSHITGIGTEDDVTMLGVSAVGSAGIIPVALPSSPTVGMNLAGMDFAGTPQIPTTTEIDYAVSKDMPEIRLPFKWEYIQTSLNATLDPTFLGRLTTLVAYAATKNITIILDCHNFGQYGPNKIGGGVVTPAHLANLWSQLATEFISATNVIYEPMNEPSNMPNPGVWPTTIQLVINTIGAIDTTKTILIDGDGFSSAFQWVANNPTLQNLTSPGNPLVYSAHAYPDRDNSGSHSDWPTEVAAGDQLTIPVSVLDTNILVKRLTPFVQWCIQYGKFGHVGEMGVPNSNINWLITGFNAFTYLRANGIPCTPWAAGPGWGLGYAYSYEPGAWVSGYPGIVDANQMAMFTQFTGAAQPTIYALTGPANGTVSTPSSPFSVDYQGLLASPVTFTFSDNGAGGSFSSATVTLAAGGQNWNPIGSVTYTPPAGAMTTRIDVTNNGGLTNPAGVVFSTEVDLFAGLATPTNIISDIQLYASYLGPCRNMRRNSDGALLDFGFAGQALGVANLGRTLDTAAIAAWAPGGAKTVKRYSQEPAGNHMLPVFNTDVSPSTTADYPAFSIDTDGFPTDTFSNSRMDILSPLRGATGRTIIANYNYTSGADILNWDFTSAYQFGPSAFQSYPQTWVGTGEVTGTAFTVQSTIRQSLAVGQFLYGAGVPFNTTIVSGSGSSWVLNNSCTVASGTALSTSTVDHVDNEQGTMSLGTVVGEYHIYSETWQANTTNGWRTWKDGTQFARNNTYAQSLTADFNRNAAHIGYNVFIGITFAGKYRDLIVFPVAIPDSNNVAIQNYLETFYGTVRPTTIAWDIVLDFLNNTYTVSGSSVAMSTQSTGTRDAGGLLANATSTLINDSLAAIAGSAFTMVIELANGPVTLPGGGAVFSHLLKGSGNSDMLVSSAGVFTQNIGSGITGSSAVYNLSTPDMSVPHKIGFSSSGTQMLTSVDGDLSTVNNATYTTGWTSATLGDTRFTNGRITAVRLKRSGVSQIQLLTACDVVGAPGTLGAWLPGLNESGPEFNGGPFWPYNESIDYYNAQGMKIIRLPFKWAVMQPALNGTLDASSLTNIDRIVTRATGYGMTLLLDCHSFGGHETFGPIGNGTVTAANLANLWSQLATRYAANPLVAFDLMNEPGGPLTIAQWYSCCAGCQTAIRATGASGLILVPSYFNSSGARHFTNDGNSTAFIAQGFTDPNYSLTVHYYPDSSGSGTGTDAARYTGRDGMRAVVRWCRANGVKVFLGEFGVSSAPSQPWGVLEFGDLLAFMKANSDVCVGYSYWAGGPAWGSGYMYLLEPLNPSAFNQAGFATTPYGERPQMGVMKMFPASTGPVLPSGVTLAPIDGETLPTSTTMTNSYYTSNGHSAAATMGWDSPNFFPIGPFLSDYDNSIVPSASTAMTALGWNMLLSWNSINNTVVGTNGISVIGSFQGGNVSATNIVGLNTYDEPSTYALGVSTPLSTQSNAVQDPLFWWVNLTQNWANGNLPTGIPAPSTAAHMLSVAVATPNATTRHIDLQSIDQYWYSSSRDPGSFQFQTINGKTFYGLGSNMTVDQMARPSNYGDNIDQLRTYQAGNFPAPISVYIETGEAFWGQTGFATNASTSTSSPTLSFASLPPILAAGYTCTDLTTGHIIGTIQSTGTNTITLNANAAFAVSSGDHIGFTANSMAIAPPEFNASVWSIIIHGALAGFMFDHFGPTAGTGTTDDNLTDTRNTFFNTVNSGQTITSYLQANITGQLVKALAPVIKSPFGINHSSVSPAGYVYPTIHKVLPAAGSGQIDLSTHWYQGGTVTNNGVALTNGFYMFAGYRGSATDSNVTATFTVNDPLATSVKLLNAATFVGQWSGTTLTVNQISTGDALAIGNGLQGVGVPAGTVITGGSGTTWTTNNAGPTATNTALYASTSIAISGGTFTDTFDNNCRVKIYQVIG